VEALADAVSLECERARSRSGPKARSPLSTVASPKRSRRVC